jgi:hypothetical protein
MTDEQTQREARPTRAPGYRGALPPRHDRLARPWVAAVIIAFLLMLVLAGLGIPSKLLPGPSVVPIPSVPFPSASGSGVPASLVPTAS